MLGFLTLVAILNLFNAIIQLNLNGNGTTAYFRIFEVTLGSLDIQAYFWISTIITFMVFTATVFSIYRGVPTDPQVLQRIAKVEENLAVNTNMIENTQIGFFRKLEENEKANEETFRKININLEETRKQVSDNLAGHKNTLINIEKETEKNAEAVKKQATELTNLKKKIEKLEKETPPKAKLTSLTALKGFKGIRPRLATKLNDLNIATISELLSIDSASIAEKISESPEKIANIQAAAQLLMVPGIEEKHAELLVRAGITSRRELANQDPVQLYRAIFGIAKTFVDERKMAPNKIPTIEDVSTWINQAHL